MNGILYLWITTFKNQIKDLKRHPGRLIAYLVLIGLMVMAMVSSVMQESNEIASSVRPIGELGAIIFVIFMFFFVSQVLQGISSGSTLFKMADVNLLFVSPTSPKKILAYGLVRQMGMSFLFSFFILFQAGTLKSFYGVGLKGVLIIFTGYFVITFIASVISMTVYVVTSGDEKKKRLAKLVVYLCILPVIFTVLSKVSDSNGLINSVVDGLNLKFNQWIPFVGWIKALTFGAIIGDMNGLLIYLIMTVIGIVLVITVMMKSDNNYYEDVLGVTENMYNRIEDAKNGKMAEVSFNKKIKLKEIGINHGKGAWVFFFKHMLENRRAGKLIFDNSMFIQLIMVGIFTLFVKGSGGIIVAFAISTYMQLFMSLAGRWTRELTMHYIYMFPQSPFKKLIASTSEGILKSFTDGIIIFVIVGIIAKASPIDIMICIVARVGFGLVFTAADVLAERVIGKVASKGILMFLNLIVIILVALPGIIGAVVAGFALGGQIYTLLITLVWNVFISLVIIGLCRNVLHSLEQNN
ncbi:Uncharacterised protein [uncultured Clostridium sp.]|uniref:putative ABC exporter domain-containing protein n=1 Tax=uncultured Clostridium sp. TaxID=59620 RepID=UPI0008214DE0|nr:putative ABC exporter domain-containing protein [uncultured Clostridium sp.]SCJ62580.1 Uncharacterised protein [uncultured Clostridium sp.]